MPLKFEGRHRELAEGEERRWETYRLTAQQYETLFLAVAGISD
jgi:hypothetical protein